MSASPDSTACWRGDGQDPVSARNRAGTDVDGRGDDLVRRNLAQEMAERGDVGDCVERPDFVEVNLPDAFPMCVGLRRRERLVRLRHVVAHGWLKRKSADDV